MKYTPKYNDLLAESLKGVGTYLLIHKVKSLIKRAFVMDKLIRGAVAFIIGSALIGYAIGEKPPVSILCYWAGLMSWFLGIMLILTGNCTAHDQLTSERLDESDSR